ncbi:adenylosuccinate lyase [Pyrolobus fumarii 1A]|uniref:Adenylosuccinate lyase n=1 Tax=Pyrolobus fumarii (strain DSM 11204 / 1A) TaxID=694429 RepID=G0EDW7_PYRF1|nr:adenylosuccinate lyase [Pyrolobus fumarii]AEM38736.1 adenylosuccinate lyase [Pyrolobus fumarii 1A]
MCVFEWRYGSKEMRDLLSLESWMRHLLRVEVAVVEAMEELGLAPGGIAAKVRDAAESITVKEWLEAEKKRGHDIAALAELLGEKAGGEAARYVHLGLTSYDVVDTAWAIIIREAVRIVKARVKHIIKILSKLAKEYVDVPVVGRTHGQHASPVTLGFKLANYVYELARRYEALCDVEKRVVKAKIGGSVGTLAFWTLLWGVEKALALRKKVAEKLGLEPHVITTQVAPREALAELACQLASLAGVLERFALEVRELSRPEIGEWVEAPLGRVGSSAMPHKANPVVSERICGLSRITRGLVVPALENIALWHERDLTNSSAERVWIPHMLLTIDQMLVDTIELLEKRLRFNLDAMKRNLELTRGHALSEAVVALLVSKGMARHEAHRLVMSVSREAYERGEPLVEALLRNPVVARLVTRDELEKVLRPEGFVGAYRALVEEALSYAEKTISKC